MHSKKFTLGRFIETLTLGVITEHGQNQISEEDLSNGVYATFDSKLRSIIEQLKKNQISEVDLSYPSSGILIASELFQEFCAALSLCTSVTSLNLSSNYLGTEISTVLCGQLSQSLTTLNLSKGTIHSEEASEHLSDFLSNCKSLTSLDLSGNTLRSQGIAALSEGLRGCTSLSIFNFSSNFLGDSSGYDLAYGLELCPLTNLNLSMNQLEVAGTIELSKMLKQCPTLTALNLSSSHMENAGAIALATALPHLPLLEILQLNRCSIRPDGLQALIEVLPHCPYLSVLELNMNLLWDDMTEALAAVLPRLPSLSRLVMSHNRIGSSGGQALATALPQCPSLGVLDLNDNQLDDAVAQALAKVLPHCPALVVLALHSNEMTSVGGQALLEVLDQCPALSEFDCSAWRDLDLSHKLDSALIPVVKAAKPRQVRSQALLKAAARGDFDTLRKFIATGTSVWSLDEEYNTALHEGARAGHLDIVKWLLKNNNLLWNARNLEGKTAAQIAASSQHATVQRFFKAYSSFIKLSPSPFKPSIVVDNSHQPLKASARPIHNSNSAEDILGKETEAYSIENSKLELQERLGAGAFGEVFRGIWRPSKGYYPITVAIKQFKLKTSTQEVMEDFIHEVKLHSELDSPYIVKLFGVSAGEPYSMVMEFMTHGTLRDLLDSQSPEQLTWDIRLTIAKNIARGLVYLHEHTPGVYHGDLKSLNVLLKEEYEAKLGDFGLSNFLDASKNPQHPKTVAAKSKGSLLWMPPELFNDDIEHNAATDIYSFAVLLWELASHLFPYASAKEDEKLIEDWIKDGERESFDDRTPNTPAEYEALTKRCWSQNPTDRLSARAALKALENIKLLGKNPQAPTFFPTATSAPVSRAYGMPHDPLPGQKPALPSHYVAPPQPVPPLNAQPKKIAMQNTYIGRQQSAASSKAEPKKTAMPNTYVGVPASQQAQPKKAAVANMYIAQPKQPQNAAKAIPTPAKAPGAAKAPVKQGVKVSASAQDPPRKFVGNIYK